MLPSPGVLNSVLLELMITECEVVSALKAVSDPDTGRSIADSMKLSVTVNGGDIGVIWETPERMNEAWEKHCRIECDNAIRNGMTGVANITVVFVPQKRAQVQKRRIQGVRNIVLVASGKGGVGKSTVATHIALSLVRCGYKVALVDADIYGPSIPEMLGVDSLVEVDDMGMMLPVERYGLKSISIGNIVSDINKAIVWRGPMLTKAVNKLMLGTKWGDVDYMIVDTPPGTGDVHISLMGNFAVSGAVLVSTPHALSVQQTMKTFNMSKNLQTKLLGVVENMSYLLDEKSGHKRYLFGQNGGRKVAEVMGIPFLGEIMIDPKLCMLTELEGDGLPDLVCTVYDSITNNMLDSLSE